MATGAPIHVAATETASEAATEVDTT